MNDNEVIWLDAEFEGIDLTPAYTIFHYTTNHIDGYMFKVGSKFRSGDVEYTVIEDHCLNNRTNGGVTTHTHQMKARM